MYFRFLYIIIFSACLGLYSCQHTLNLNKTEESHYVINANKIDSNIFNGIQPYKMGLDSIMNKVVAISDGVLTKADYESTLSNFACDAAWVISSNILKQDSSKIDLVVLNKGGLRNSLPKGNITIGHLYELMPFENELVMIKITGQQFLAFLKQLSDKGNLPFKGMTLSIKDKQANDVFIHQQSFDSNRTYTIITSDYLANGGDNCSFFVDALERKSLDKKIRDAFIDYCQLLSSNGRHIKPYTDGRVQLSK